MQLKYILALSVYVALYAPVPVQQEFMPLSDALQTGEWTKSKLAASFVAWRLAYWMSKWYGQSIYETLFEHPEQLQSPQSKLFISALMAGITVPAAVSYMLGKSAFEPYKKDFLSSIKNRFTGNAFSRSKKTTDNQPLASGS